MLAVGASGMCQGTFPHSLQLGFRGKQDAVGFSGMCQHNQNAVGTSGMCRGALPHAPKHSCSLLATPDTNTESWGHLSGSTHVFPEQTWKLLTVF